MSDAGAALVIGNTDGIGLGLTRALLEEGRRVVGVSRRASELGHDAYDHRVHDVGEPGWPETLARLERETGPYDLAVHCAAIGSDFDPAKPEADRQVFEVNLMSAVSTLGVLAGPMVERGRGHLIVLSSIADSFAATTRGEGGSYCASKAGLTSYLKSMAFALRPRGVAVTNVRFGFVDTKLAQAPVRPMMMPVDRAVRVILRCVETRPFQRTCPRRADALAQIYRLLVTLRIWGSATPLVVERGVEREALERDL